MREHCLAELAAAWAQLVATYGQAAPDLAGAVLGAVQRYVPWISIGLVANDKCAARFSTKFPSSGNQARTQHRVLLHGAGGREQAKGKK